MIKIKNFDNYAINENGQVTNLKTGRHLKPGTNQKGYKHLQLSGKTRSIHRMVYEAYVSEIPKDLQINHIDGDKSNNYISNLEIVTRKENMAHAVRIGLIKSGASSNFSKQVESINVITEEVINSFGSIVLASRQTGIAGSAISNVCNGKRVTAGGYKWRFQK